MTIGAQSRRRVRSVLRDLVTQGLLEEVQRKARHVLFRIPPATPPAR
ncbi:hypothetical protein [Kitasatospora sp. NPDC087314]